MAWVPYLLLVVFVLVWGERRIKPTINQLGELGHPRVAADDARARRWHAGDAAEWCPGCTTMITRVPPVVAETGALRGALRAELAERVGYRVLAGDPCDRARAPRLARQGREDLRRHVQAAEVRDPDHRLDAGARVPDELLGHDVDARPRAGGDRRRVPVLQRGGRLARRVPHRQRHVGERAVRQPAGRDGECARTRTRS